MLLVNRRSTDFTYKPLPPPAATAQTRLSASKSSRPPRCTRPTVYDVDFDVDVCVAVDVGVTNGVDVIID